MGHTGASDRLYECFFDDTILNIKGKLAGTLLRCAPAYTVSKSGNIFNLISVYPLALFRDGSRFMLCALIDRTHFFNFCCVLHY
jgi:hypothetical protein